MKQTDKTLALLSLIVGLTKDQNSGNLGLRIVTVKTAEPDPVTFVMEGTKLALDPDIFEIPIESYPLREGDSFLAFPLVTAGDTGRWAIIQKVNGGVVMATMKSANSLQPDGMAATYGADRLIIPPFFAVKAAETMGPTPADNVGASWEPDGSKHPDVIRPLEAGDRVSIAPTWDPSAKKIKYVILNKY